MRKKKGFLFALGLMTALAFSGCGSDDAVSKEEAKTETSMEDVKEIKLGEYKGLKLAKLSEEVAETEVEEAINANLKMGAEKEQIKEGKVKEGDTVNIAYEGKKDGVPFDGGTADSYDLTIGSGTFIDGFEDGLIGVSVGETVDLDLTFPEDYGSEELAGKAVVFTVTVNYICGDEILPELTDAWVKENTKKDAKTVEEYRAEIKEQLTEELKEKNRVEKENAILTLLVNNTEISEYPEEKVEAYKKQVDENLSSMAGMYGMEKEDFVKNYYQMSMDEYEKKLSELAKDAAAQEMIINEIADKENISCTEEDIKAKKDELIKQYGFKDEKEMEEQYGKEKLDEEVAKDVLYGKVIDFISENAVYEDVQKEASESK